MAVIAMNPSLRKLKGRNAAPVKKSRPAKDDSLKYAGAYIADDKADALEALAKSKGYRSTAAMIRAIYDAALAEGKIDP